MTMDAAEVERLKAMMEWEGTRTAPPAGFPALPDMPAARYTSPEYFALEQEPGVEHDQLGARSLREAGGVVEHPERHLELLAAVDVAHERCERRVHRQHDAARVQRFAE